MNNFPYSPKDSRGKYFCLPTEIKKSHNEAEYLSRSWGFSAGGFYDIRATSAVLEKFSFAKLPRRSTINRIDEVLEKNIEEEFSNEHLEQYNQYKFIAYLVAFMGELRWKAERESKKIRDELYYRLDYDLPLDWDEICKSFESKSDDPPMELIAQIATNYSDELLDLANEPRKILRQHLRKEHLSRVQQIDNRCMIWLTRQPGSNTVQKAGSRQQILAVVRQENHDTLENRVLKSMLERCCAYTSDYCFRYKKFEKSDRLKKVKMFASKANIILNSPIFSQIRNLHRIPKPNYVLRFDRHYKEMWHWFQRLVKQQEDTEMAWQWQNRLFADWCHIAVTVAAISLSKTFFKHNMWMRSLAKDSNWFRSIDWPSPLLINDKIMEIMLPSMADAPGIAGEIGADMVISIANQNNDKRKWLYIWCIHIFSPSNTNNEIQTINNDLKSTLKNISPGIGIPIAGLVISSNFSSSNSLESKIKNENGIMSVSLVVNGQNSEMQSSTITELLKILTEFIQL